MFFTKVLQYVESHSQSYMIKEKKTRAGLRLLLTFDKITSIDKALKVLEPLDFRVKEEEETKV